MKSAIVILALLSNSFLFSQKIEIIDSIHGNKLPYALVIDSEIAFYTDEDGVFDIGSIKSDTISIKFLGYKEKKIASTNLKKGVIMMTPEKIILKEVVIHNQEKPFIIGYSKKKPKNFNSWPLSIGNEILVNLLPKENLKDSEIILLKIKLEKNRFQKGQNNNIIATYRINFYNDNLGILHSSIPDEVNINTKDEIIIKIPENTVFIQKTGIWIGLEFLRINDMDNNNELNTIHPQLTEVISDGFKAKTYFKFHLDPNKEMFDLNEILKQSGAGDIKRNLNISLIVRK